MPTETAKVYSMSNPDDRIAAAPPEAEEVAKREQPSTQAARGRTVRFVVVFLVSVLALLMGYYQGMNDTKANDWYLFLVATHTSWLLNPMGYQCIVGNAIRYRGQEAEARAVLRNEPVVDGIVASSEPPLTPWESWRYSAVLHRREVEEARKKVELTRSDRVLPEEFRAMRLANDEKALMALEYQDIGPLVSFILRPSIKRQLDDARAELAALGPEAPAKKKSALESQVTELDAQIAQAGKDPKKMAELRRDTAFSFTLIPDCGAIPPMAIFFSAVLAFPTQWWKRLVGVLVGIPALYWVNAFRLAVLAVIGALDGGGRWFRFAHEYVWQGIYIVFVVALWMAWVEFVVRRKT